MNTFTIMTLAVLTILLAACGGGGSNGGSTQSDAGNPSDVEPNVMDNSNTGANNFAPDGDKLLQNAGSSAELYVERSFTFDNIHAVYLSISAKDQYGMALDRTLLKVYLVPPSVDIWVDEIFTDASLIASGFTNALGVFERNLEIPGTDHNLLIVLQTIGLENKALIPINDSQIRHTFEPH